MSLVNHFSEEIYSELSFFILSLEHAKKKIVGDMKAWETLLSSLGDITLIFSHTLGLKVMWR